jgi:hypothetical protein
MSAFAAPHNPLTIWGPDADSNHKWSVVGDLREIVDIDANSDYLGESTNYVIADRLIRDGWFPTQMDPEFSCFYAYVATEAEAIRMQRDALRIANVILAATRPVTP